LPEVVDNRTDAEKARDKLISQDVAKIERKEVTLSDEQQELRDQIDRFIAD